MFSIMHRITCTILSRGEKSVVTHERKEITQYIALFEKMMSLFSK